MTLETEQLEKKIKGAKKQFRPMKNNQNAQFGLSIAINILTDLAGCVLIGAGLGVVFQKWFDTSPWVVIAFIFLGSVAGLWTVIKYGISLDREKTK